MKNRTIHPAEFKGWRPNMRDAALWQTILWAGLDENGEPLEKNHDMSSPWREDMEKLQDQFYAWSDQADDILIAGGCGHLSLDEILGDKAEHLYALVRDGHGVGMTDDWHPSRKEYRCCEALERAAKDQGPIGAYVGDDGRVYLAFC